MEYLRLLFSSQISALKLICNVSSSSAFKSAGRFAVGEPELITTRISGRTDNASTVSRCHLRLGIGEQCAIQMFQAAIKRMVLGFQHARSWWATALNQGCLWNSRIHNCRAS